MDTDWQGYGFCVLFVFLENIACASYTLANRDLFIMHHRKCCLFIMHPQTTFLVAFWKHCLCLWLFHQKCQNKPMSDKRTKVCYLFRKLSKQRQATTLFFITTIFVFKIGVLHTKKQKTKTKTKTKQTTKTQ